MLRKIIRKIRANPLDSLLKKAKKNNNKTFLLAWNRALGDVSLGLYAVVYRIKQYVEDAQITFIIREDLKEAFELLGLDYICVNFWKRYLPFDIYHTLKILNLDHKKYDIIIDKVDPNYWVKWQISNLVPKLKWKDDFDRFHKEFQLPKDKILIGVQACIETKHSPWRNWPSKYFQTLFAKAHKDNVFVLFGTDRSLEFRGDNIIDIRGKTKLLDALSILKNRCSYFISLDSGLLSLFYYLDRDFPIKLIALWGSKDVGVIKQNVISPNKKLVYDPLVYTNGLDNLKPEKLLEHIYPLDVENILRQNNQKKLLEVFANSTIEEKQRLIFEITKLDSQVLKKQKSFFSKKIKLKFFSPLKHSNEASLYDKKIGKKVVSNQKVANIIMAAGQGSRLGFDGPKALFKINNKTLIEYAIEKIIKKQKKFNTKLYLSIMTSHLNHEEIRKFLHGNEYFGLKKEQIDFFEQKKAPFLDKNGFWIVKDSKILLAPDGNGSIFNSFANSKILEKYSQKGIKYISIIPIDNPLCDPFDEAFFGFHVNNQCDVTIKCFKRLKEDVKKGAIGESNGKIKIIEYTYLDKNEIYNYSNSGIYLVNLDFIQKVKNIEFDYNFVMKKISNNTDIYAYKAESFIFDSFEYASKIKTLVDIKENFYAPIKDLSNIKEIEKILLLENPPVNVLK